MDQHKTKQRKSSKAGDIFSKTTPKTPAYEIRSDRSKPSDKDTWEIATLAEDIIWIWMPEGLGFFEGDIE